MTHIEIWKKLHQPKPKSGAKVSFSKRIIPKDSYLFIATGLCCWASLVILTVISAKNDGKSGYVTGIIGFAAFMMSIVGVVNSCRMLMDEHNFYRYPIISLAVNASILLLLILIYGTGLAYMLIYCSIV